MSESLRPGKLKISDVWDPEDGGGGGNKPALQVGKLNIKDLFQNQEENNNIEKPKVKISLCCPFPIFLIQYIILEYLIQILRIGNPLYLTSFKCLSGGFSFKGECSDI